MNSIDALGDKAATLVEYIRAMPTKDSKATGRANEYVGRLRGDFLERHDTKNDAGNGKKKGKNTK